MSPNSSLMSKEIAEIPQAAQRFLQETSEAVRRCAEDMRARDPGLVATVARGSSDHAATYLKYAFELAGEIPVASIGPSIASIYRRQLRLNGSVCVGISQSGRSPDIVELMRSANVGGALTVAITNDPASPLARSTAHPLALRSGPERSVAATKTFVASVLAGLALLAEWQEDEALRAAVTSAPDVFSDALACDWSLLSDRLARANSAFVLGRGPSFAIANEIALKFKETSGIHAESYSAAEVLHGPAALVEAGFPVLVLAVEDEALEQVRGTASRLAGQGADVFMTASGGADITELPAAKGLHPLLAPVALVVSFYVMVESLARRRGFEPDVPPHLRKVTETL